MLIRACVLSLVWISIVWGQETTRLLSAIRLDELEVIVAGISRPVAYTNKEAGVFYTETGSSHGDPWQGWRIMSVEIMEDYALHIDGSTLQRSDAMETRVYPDRFVRMYSNGVLETVTLLDSIDAILVELAGVRGSAVSLLPYFQNATGEGDFVLSLDETALRISRLRHQHRTPTEDYPVWVCVGSSGTSSRAEKQESLSGNSFSPGAFEAGPSDGRIAFFLMAGDNEENLRGEMESLRAVYQQRKAARRARMESVLAQSFFRSNNPAFDNSVHWARLSMDALIMNQRKKGIFAGLPWFDNYWGRDSFIALPGATLVSGDFDEARNILRSFAEWQDTLPASPTYGRIPNLVTVNSIAYNTADGTPWFIAGLHEYFSLTDDSQFVREMLPVVRRSIEGTFRNHSDTNLFLTHADAETWMDAVGPDGPWTPRGNRACDLQALWHRQLNAAARLAECTGDTIHPSMWRKTAIELVDRFNAVFLDRSDGRIYDHLNADGSPDTMLRPNQLFALDLLKNTGLRSNVLSTVTANLVYKHGVASLDQDDEMFHPYHHYQPYYVQDAAYHQGIVWTWLAGIWIDRMCEAGLQDTAWIVTENMASHMLNRGAIGTLSELLDAVPRPGESEPRLSGTYSQAWSLAEYLRVLHRSYLGVRADLPSAEMTVTPRLPRDLSYVHTTLRLGRAQVPITFERTNNALTITLEPSDVQDSLTVHVNPPPILSAGKPFDLRFAPASGLVIEMREGQNRAVSNGRELQIHVVPDRMPRYEFPAGNPSLALPIVREGLKSLKGPAHPLLDHADISGSPSHPLLLIDCVDTAGDDRGPGSYSYPMTSYLLPGSLDLRRMTVAHDEQLVQFMLTFTSLSNPGWHPEYGFQLTYAAILIDKDGKVGTGSSIAGMNSGYRIPGGYGYEQAIYIGGGIRITDDRNTILAEYLPRAEDVQKPLGNAATATIRFSLPTSILGTPEAGWRFTVLIGCQDDHGGAGIGEFRSVAVEAGEWIGGGRTSASDANVYDVLHPDQCRRP